MICKERPHLSVLFYTTALAAALYYVKKPPEKISGNWFFRPLPTCENK